jgi:phosphohistidine phosphatase|tara:strand:- start:33 stop:518 length:486 start_codon:yes stop_codon:yes gene_type:complete
MKTLYMVRHAKSSWKHDVIDHKRPLKGRGRKDCELVSSAVKRAIIPPDKIISSDANRALSTGLYFKEALEVSNENFTTNNELYDFEGQNIIKFVKDLDNSLDLVMIIGHNHAFTSIANMLGDKYFDNVPTCGFLMIEFDTDSWNSVKAGATKMAIFPRDLK